tara:strand:+ start:1345 stop:2352 length:1008 start_codon:yes stop_codon:yes gene_type:complete
VSNTIGDLVDRVYREYLEPVDEVESYSYLSSGINDSVDSITYDGNLFSIEEEDALDAGAIVEVGQEIMYTTSLDASANTITVKRGQRGTTAAAHSAGDLIKIAPAFPRKNVYEAVVDQIKNLYPTLFAVETIELTASTGYKLLGTHGTDGDTHNYLVAPLKAISQYTDWQSGSDQTGLKYNGVAIEMIDLPNPFVYTDDTQTERTKTYTTGPDVVHAVQFVNISAGHTVYVTFKKKFVQPTAESTTLASIGLEIEYEPIIMTGVAAQLIAGKDISKLNASYITEQLETSVSPIGSSNSIGQSLLRYQQLLIQQARSNLRSKYPEPVQLNSILYST